MKYIKGFVLLFAILVAVSIAVLGYSTVKNNDSKNTPTIVATVPTANKDDIGPGACVSTFPPSLSLTSPKGGELFYQNSALMIDWHSCNVAPNTHLKAELVDELDMLKTVELSCEDVSWGPPCLAKYGARLETFRNTVPAGQYQLRLTSLDDPNISATSNSFIISSQNAIPSYIIEDGDNINGHHIGFLKTISTKNGTQLLSIDYVAWVNCSDDPACPNGYNITNTNNFVRTFPISPKAVIRLQTYSQSTTGYGQNVDIDTFVSLFTSSSQSYPVTQIPFWITLSNGEVTEITEQYIP